MKASCKTILEKDMSRRTFFIVVLILTAIKLVMASQQALFIIPEGSPIDDTLMYDAAVSITKGEWLGSYNWLTLSKYCFFPVYLALVHTLHIPYLFANQILQLASCAFAVWALAPALNKRIYRTVLFTALLFNPAVNCAEVQLRVYRDSISAQLAILFFAGFVGAALRHKQGAKNTLPFLLIGGFGLAASYLNREDGIWLMPFAVCATITVCVYLVIEKQPLKCLLQLIPYAVLLVGVLAVCFMNNAYYGRFIVSDYTSKEFKDACGALMRVSEKTQSIEQVPVTLAARRLVAENVPQFADVEANLENEFQLVGYGSLKTLEYNAGSFFWALRSSVYICGYADTALEAQEYYSSLAKQINDLCDSSVIDGGKKQSGTLMPYRAEYTLPLIGETITNIGRTLTFAETEPYVNRLSIGRPETLDEYEAFLLSKVVKAAKANSDEPYYSIYAQMIFFAMDVIKYVMAVCTCVTFAAALAWQVYGLVNMIKQKDFNHLLLWIILLGVLLCAVLRCAIIAYMFVTSFNPTVPHVMYLCAVHPLLIIYGIVGSAQFLNKKLKGERICLKL